MRGAFRCGYCGRSSWPISCVSTKIRPSGATRQIVMDMRQILPEDIGILVVLDEPVAPGRVADRDVERQQVAVGVEMGLLDVDMRVGQRRVYRRGACPRLG